MTSCPTQRILTASVEESQGTAVWVSSPRALKPALSGSSLFFFGLLVVTP